MRYFNLQFNSVGFNLVSTQHNANDQSNGPSSHDTVTSTGGINERLQWHGIINQSVGHSIVIHSIVIDSIFFDSIRCFNR